MLNMGSGILEENDIIEPSDDKSQKKAFMNLKTRLSNIKLKNRDLNIGSIVSRIRGKNPVTSNHEQEDIHRNLLTYTPPEGWVEMERYWTDMPYSFVSVLENPDEKHNIYRIVEPSMTNFEYVLLEEVKMYLEDILTLKNISDLENLTVEGKTNLLRDNTYRILSDFSQNDPYIREKIFYYVKRDFIEHGKISAIMRDQNIEDVWCNGIGLPVHVFHTGYRNLETNVIFDSHEELDAFVMRIAQQAGRHLSSATPILDTVMTDGSRINITYSTEVSPNGTSFSIRRIKKVPITPLDLIAWKTFSSDLMAYFWMCVENHRNILFCGGTATGKTSAMNAICMFIPGNVRIVTLEDTKEIQLPHSNWVSTITRENMPGMSVYQIDLEGLLRAALRQRPEYLLVGEVRGREAQILFQAMNAGHATCSTFHAGNVKEVINRFTHQPINVPVAMFSALDVMCILTIVYKEGTQKRRVLEVAEVKDVTDVIQTHISYQWDEPQDMFEFSYSYALEHIRHKRGFSQEELTNELARRARFLEMLIEMGIRDYQDVVKWIHEYNKHGPNALEKLFQVNETCSFCSEGGFEA
jgi:flagellar protein FlaI